MKTAGGPIAAAAIRGIGLTKKAKAYFFKLAGNQSVDQSINWGPE